MDGLEKLNDGCGEMCKDEDNKKECMEMCMGVGLMCAHHCDEEDDLNEECVQDCMEGVKKAAEECGGRCGESDMCMKACMEHKAREAKADDGDKFLVKKDGEEG